MRAPAGINVLIRIMSTYLLSVSMYKGITLIYLHKMHARAFARYLWSSCLRNIWAIAGMLVSHNNNGRVHFLAGTAINHLSKTGNIEKTFDKIMMKGGLFLFLFAVLVAKRYF